MNILDFSVSCASYTGEYSIMQGPKLDARSYAILILMVIASLLTLNSFAQRSNNNESSLSDAAAINNLADATREVAAANQEIARSLQDVAKAISELQLNVSVAGSEGSEPAGGAVSSSGTIELLPVEEPVGTIDLN
jgi:hypothetical protein